MAKVKINMKLFDVKEETPKPSITHTTSSECSEGKYVRLNQRGWGSRFVVLNDEDRWETFVTTYQWHTFQHGGAMG